MSELPTPNLIFQFNNYINTALGIENILRLLQALSQILATQPTVDVLEVEHWRILGRQFSLGRRYFRYFQFLTYFRNAWDTFSGKHESVSRRGRAALSIEVCMLSSYGIYLLLEAFTILDALGAHSTEWSRMMLVEANKFWFYAILFSILSNVWQIICAQLTLDTSQLGGHEERRGGNASLNSSRSKKSKKSAAEGSITGQSKRTELHLKASSLTRNLIVNGCDLLMPGAFVGWIDVSPLVVSSAMVLSTVLVGRDRWVKAQGKT
ncbi:hypothetical protein LOZ65_002715 [Ophidiomyces ophidiicola]|nr:hypothetical protein LOZ65_002715 [Ophidiomyces ophidiicola]